MSPRAARILLVDSRAPELHLLRDCLSLGLREPSRPPARQRLEATLGRDLTRFLLTSLTANGYR
jgi:hypothetical protein